MQTKVKDKMTPSEKLITVESSDAMEVLLQKLFENKVSSLPVFDKDEGRYNAFFDCVDAVSYFVQYYEKRGPNGIDDSFFQTQYSKDLLGSSYRNWANTFVSTISEGDCLKRVLDTMVNLSNIHRLPVFNFAGEFRGMLSQSDVFYSIKEYIHLFPLVTNTVQNLGLGDKQGVKARTNTPLCEVFKLIANNRVSGVPILDDDGVLVGNISASDIKLIGNKPTNLDVLKKSAGEFMVRRKPIAVQASTTIQQVVALVTTERIHRVYVVDASGEYKGVISLVDVLSLLAKYL